MTPTERAKRSDALYYETVSVNRRVLCDMVANREADLEDAKAESEHMRLKAVAVAGELQEENERLRAENAMLGEQLAKARDPQRIGGTADPESFVYAIEQLREFRWQHATNDEEAIPYINNVADAHERENAKLRELVKSMYYDLTNMTFPPDWVTDYEADMRELGLEVEG